MAQPVWITSSGSLGTVPEGIYYNVQVQAQAGAGETVFYRVIAGSLPSGTTCSNSGNIAGVPTSEVIAGQDVTIAGAQITSKFTIRAYTTVNNQSTGLVSRLCDQTFTITVVGKNTPGWITPAGSIGDFYDGALLEPGYQFQYTDNPLPGVTPISLVSGQLPPGITLSGTGLLSGYFAPNPAISVLAGYSRDGQPYSPDPPTPYKFDFNTLSESYTYQFTLQVTNGVQRELRTFTMSVWNPAIFNASAVTIQPNPTPPPTYTTDPMSADNGNLPASISSIIPPVIFNPQGSIGTYRNDNFFAYQFIGYDYSNNPIIYQGFNLPPGLTLDATTGWLYGHIPNLGITEETYNFEIQASEPFDVNPYTVSPLYHYSITFVGAIGTEITWISPSDLGSINNGSISTFTVEAKDLRGISLQYRLKPGSDSQLPQGLTLLPSGNIVGRVSFNVFDLDNSTTTFDSGTTTFDLDYKFTVNAYSVDGTVSVFKEFTIHVIDAYTQPYNNLYISCMPPRSDRALIDNLLHNNDIFPQALLYRPDDPNFGVAQDVVYNHAYGLSAATVDDYVTALQLNHYWKNLTLGEIKTAQALDDLGNILYEVVYSEVIDDQVNSAGESVGKSVVLPYPVNPNTIFQIDDVFPNSLQDMRDQVIDSVGQVSNILPRWMYSKQKDGRILGFTPAWVIAYTAPNASGQIAYNINQIFGTDKLNLIDFKADRYEIDRSMTVNWDPETVSIDITDIVGDGTTATIDYASEPAVTILPGDIVTVSGVVPVDYNKKYYVLTSVGTQITVSSTVTDAFVSGGTLTTSPHWVPNPPQIVTFDVKDHYQLYDINLEQNFYSNVPFDTVPFDSDILPSMGSGYSIGDEFIMPGTYFGGQSVNLAITGASGDGDSVTLSFDPIPDEDPLIVNVGDTISVVGNYVVTGDIKKPSRMNGVYTVTEATHSTIVYKNPTTVTPTEFGLILGKNDVLMEVCQITPLTTTAIGTRNSRIIIVSNSSGISAGQTVSGIGVPAGTVVNSINNTTITLSQPLTENANGSYTFGTTGSIVDAFCYGFAPFASAGTQWPGVPAIMVGGDPPSTSSAASIALNPPTSQPPIKIFGKIVGTKLTATGGSPAIGQLLEGTNTDSPIIDGTYIVAPIFGVIVGSPNVTTTSITGTGVFATGTYNSVTQKSTTGLGTGAVFNVRKPNLGNAYINVKITVSDGGEGYQVGDYITIAGSDLGGTSPANDLTFRLGNTISNTRCWTVSKDQTMPFATTINARTSILTIGGTVTGTFIVGDYISTSWEVPSSSATIANNTQITLQLTSAIAPVATTTATGTNNTRIIVVADSADIAAGQLVTGTGIPAGTVVDGIVGSTVTLSQALTQTASGSYDFKSAGGAGTYAVNVLQNKATQAIIGTDVIFDIESAPGQETIFDGGSLQFATPADRNTNTDTFDRYVLYPKDNIIDNLPQSVTWNNDTNTAIEWVNDATPPNPEAFWNT